MPPTGPDLMHNHGGQSPMTAPDRTGLVGALLHGLAVLDLFDREHTVLGIGEMARQLGVHRSTASRLAATLAAAGYLEPVEEQGRYRLAGKLAALGELVTAGTDLRRAALPPLENLVARFGETGHLAVLEGREAVTVAVVDGWHTVRMHSFVGKRSPAHASAMGKVLLASLDPIEVSALYATPDSDGRPDGRLEGRTPRTITTLPALHDHLAQVRDHGDAIDQEELEPGLCCVGAPLRNHTGAVVASISLSGPASRLHPAAIPPIATAVRHTAHQISQRLGGARPL